MTAMFIMPAGASALKAPVHIPHNATWASDSAMLNLAMRQMQLGLLKQDIHAGLSTPPLEG